MRWSEVVTLLKVTEIENDYGDVEKVTVPHEVFANKKSVRQSEFYQAQAIGFKPELVFEVRSFDYDKQEQLEYDKKYNIIRTYDRGEFIELVCEGVVNNGNA